MIAITVAPSRAQPGFAAASIAAWVRLMPCFRRTTIPSATTMALSTIIPSAITSAPRDTRCRSIFMAAMTMKVPRIVRISAPPMMTPIRQPMKIASTARTIRMASARLIMKALMAVVTRSLCQATL